MQEIGMKNPNANLATLGINPSKVNWNLAPDELTKQTVELGQGSITDMGALAVNTGKFTGRSPKDKLTVKDAKTENSVDWSDINIAISPAHFDKIYAEKINERIKFKNNNFNSWCVEKFSQIEEVRKKYTYINIAKKWVEIIKKIIND